MQLIVNHQVPEVAAPATESFWMFPAQLEESLEDQASGPLERHEEEEGTPEDESFTSFEDDGAIESDGDSSLYREGSGQSKRKRGRPPGRLNAARPKRRGRKKKLKL